MFVSKKILQKRRWHNGRAKKIGQSPHRNKSYDPNRRRISIVNDESILYREGETVIAPSNLSISENMSGCLQFFKKLRKERSVYKDNNFCYVRMSLSNVVKIDYATICVLCAIINDLRSNKVFLWSDLPINKKCNKEIEESGLLNSFYDDSGKPFKKSQTSDLLFIEMGSKKLTTADNKRISETLKKIVGYLTNNERHCKKLRTIVLEICGNSIEWGGTKKRQWLLGIKYDKNKVIFTVTDVGRGILKTLNIKFKKKMSHFFKNTSDDQILLGAFEKKYGSRSEKENRNKGLPAVKSGFDSNLLKDLKVLTNNVFLCFDSIEKSEVMSMKKEFKGTLYRWEITKENISNII